MATLTTAILDPTAANPDGKFKIGNKLNIDAVSSLIGGVKTQPVFMVKGSKDMLKKFNKSASRVMDDEDEGQARTIKAHYSTADSGNLIAVVDDYLKSLQPTRPFHIARSPH